MLPNHPNRTKLDDYLPEGQYFLAPIDLITLGYGSRATVYRELNEHEIPAMQTDSGRWLIPRDSFEIYMLEHMLYPDKTSYAAR